MRKAFLVVAVLAAAHMVFAGGLVTNTNQSAQFVRSLSRNASTQVDAIYFNPAGLTQLEDGWHVAFHNQTIMQEKTIENSILGEYVGEVSAPFFPNFYAALKKDKWAVSFGFGPNGGGGSADFKDGLPSFAMPLSVIPGLISSMGIPTSAYQADISFKGSSVYYGFQVNGSYEINDMFAVALGARYISAVNTYEGGIRNIQINPVNPAFGMDGSFMSAVQFFQALSQVNPAAAAYVPMVQDVEVDAKQTGSAITPIIGVNIRPMENLNIGIKYELNTTLVLTNETKVDGSGLFKDGDEVKSDIPAILAIGAEYAFTPQLRAQLSVNSYFDKSADWGGKEDLIDSNYLEFAIGAEYDISDAFLVSAGFLTSQSGVSEEYQSDITHSLSSNTIGLGVAYKLSDALVLDLGDRKSVV